MAFVRPIVYVYQELIQATPTTVPPDLQCCLVGPCYYIQDYTEDKSSILAAEFVKTGQTANAPCDAGTGVSTGKPDDSADFLVMTNPPNHKSGGVLDASSVQVYMDEAYIDLKHGIDGGMTLNQNHFTSTTGDFVNKKVAVGDRVILNKTGDAAVVIKRVLQVVSATELVLNANNKSADTVPETSIKWRIEHALDDVLLDSAFYAIAGNQITIKTGSTGILATYQALSWTVNYGKLYVGYRELRTDLQDVRVLTNSTEISSVLGREDERNPLAVAASVAFKNTNTQLQVFGVREDSTAGQSEARDKMSTRADIYAIVPVTGSLSGSTWLTGVIGMWKSHCEAFAVPEKAKFRVAIGSYDVLPTTKSSAPPSLTGNTEDGGAGDYDVFVDPDTNTKFVTDEVGSTHLLDVAHGEAGLFTLDTNKHIFSVGASHTPYGAAKQVLGAIGEKRLRVVTGSKWAAAHLDKTCAYAVRNPILENEAAGSAKKIATGVALGDNGGKVRLTLAGAFSGVIAGDVAHIINATDTDYEGGFIVIGTPTANTIDLELVYAADDTVSVNIYTPITSKVGATIGALNHVTATGKFTNAAVGDIMCILQDVTETGNVGMWVISSKISDNEVIVAAGTDSLATPSTTANIVTFRSIAANGGCAHAHVRRRLTQLRDNSATFTTSVVPGELIEIPYPADASPLRWDTAKTTWPIDVVVSDEVLKADLEELAPKVFTDGYSANDCPYRVSIELNKDAQVDELNSTIESLQSSRLVMVWPNSLYLSDIKNELTGIQNRQTGQYLACTVGGMIAGLPSHQGFTFIGAGGVTQLFNSNFYFTDDNLTDLRGGGWYVFVQDTESSLPYTIHEVTTDVSTYKLGELMSIKNFDYVSTYFKKILEQFLGRYNITPETISLLSASLQSGKQYLQLRVFPRIGAPLLDMTDPLVQTVADEIDRLEVYCELTLPAVLNQIGLHLKA